MNRGADEWFGILKFPSISRIPLPRNEFQGAAKANKQGAVAGGSNEGVTSVSPHSQQALKFLHFAAVTWPAEPVHCQGTEPGCT
jgi:hypothetical protein